MPNFLSLLATYLKKLEVVRANPLSTDELSLRDALSGVLEATRAELGKGVEFVGEAKKIKYGGRPDYTVTRSQLPIGYIEAEKPDADLSHLSGHSKSQNDAFIADLDNFLLLNHFDFRLYERGKQIARVSLPEKAADLTPQHGAEWESLFSQFLQADFAPVKDPAQLAQILARRAGLLATEIFGDLEDKGSYSSAAFDQFKRELLPNLQAKEFAALYAQTLAYGLFAARTLSGESGFSVETAAKRLKAIPLLASLFRNFEAHLDDRLGWVLSEIVAVLKRAPMDAITSYFQKRVGRLDPMIDFYEPFLQAYDAKTREVRGVYYTPESVVGFLVRSVDALLKRDFGLETGLCEPKVQVLDPATGTGSFLFAVVDLIYSELSKTGSWNDEVEGVLARLFGLELMVAPYTIAHLKLWLQLDAYGAPPKNRLGIYLSNTLDDPRQTVKGDFDLAREVERADEIKVNNPILVVLGNPPYSGHSANLNFKNGDKKLLTAVGTRLESYKLVDGAPLGEKNPKWLNDDYVKFIAFAQNRIAQSGEGVVAFITNHGYLDNPTFRGMRASLLDSFDALYLLDLHGNVKKKEVAPDGSKDENVFAIQQGVAILLAVRKKRAEGETKPRAQVFHASLWGRQEEKYVALETTDVLSTTWQPLTPSAPMYLFVPRDEELLPEYERGWKVTDIFPVNSIGVVTARDALTIQHSDEEVWKTVEDFMVLPVEVAREKYHLGPDARDWKVDLAQADLRLSGPVKENIIPILYRPFDVRSTYFTGRSRGFICMPRGEVMRHMMQGNMALLVKRQNKQSPFSYAFVSNAVTESCVFESAYANNSVFPLYLYSEGMFGSEKRVNLSPL